MYMKKLFGALVALVAFGALGAFVVTQAQNIGYNQGYEPDQPIPFSHAKHAGDLKIDCKYCHFGADKGRHAGVPPTELCLNCHAKVKTDSPHIKKIQKAVDSGENIQWKKVNHYPDFAYFNHAQHVNVGGFACQKCHGAVEEMVVYKQEKKLGMGWCIQCHRDNGIAAPDDKFHSGDFKGSVQGKSMAGGDCSKCHY
jgi:hypothetical protein